MKESYGEGLAAHTGPESCAVVREALTGVRAGRVVSRERPPLRDADAVGGSGRPYPGCRERKTPRSPARSETPSMYGHTSRENRESPWSPLADGARGRIGKSKDTRR